MPRKPVDFAEIRSASMAALRLLLHCWLLDGQLVGSEWVTRNPRRNDRHPGSFKINVKTGRWAAFTT